MSEFSLKVLQYPDEPAWSVLFRLARLSGAEDARQFCLDWNLRLQDILSGNGLSDFASRGGYDEALLRRNSLSASDPHFYFNGETVFRQGVTAGKSRVCRRCLEQDLETADGRQNYRPHWRDWWFLQAVNACPFHDVRIATYEKGSKSGRVHYRHVDPLFPTEDGGDIRRTPCIEVDDTRWEAYVLGRLGFMERTEHKLLDRYPLGNATAVVRKTGEARMKASGHLDPQDADAYETYRSGYEALASREAFDALLDDLYRSAVVLGGKWGQRMVYGDFYDWLNHERKPENSEALYDDVRDMIRDHAWRTFPLNPNEEFFGEKPAERNLYQPHHLWTESGVHISRMRQILVGLGFCTEEQFERDPGRVFIPGDRARELLDLLRRSMNRVEVASRYGIPRGTFAVLVDKGVLASRLKTGAVGEGERIYFEGEVEEWFASLKKGAPWVETVPPGLVSLVGATRLAQVSIDRVVEALHDGTVRCRGVLVDEKPWPSILVDVDEIRAVLSDNSSEGFLGWEEAIARLSTSHLVLGALVEQEKLAATTLTGRTGKAKICFDPADLDAFDREFVSMKDAARHVGSHSRVLRQKLADVGIEPAFDLKVSPASAYYRRAEIEALEADCFRSERTLRRSTTS